MFHPSTRSLLKWRGGHATMTTMWHRDNHIISTDYISTHPASHLWWHKICQMSEPQSVLHRTGNTAQHWWLQHRRLTALITWQLSNQRPIMSALLCDSQGALSCSVLHYLHLTQTGFLPKPNQTINTALWQQTLNLNCDIKRFSHIIVLFWLKIPWKSLLMKSPPWQGPHRPVPGPWQVCAQTWRSPWLEWDPLRWRSELGAES